MARSRRATAAALQDSLRVRPVAAPVDLYARPDVQEEIGKHPILNFAGISRTVNSIAQDILKSKKARGERDQLEGERFVLEHSELVAKYESDIAAIKDDKERKARAITDLEFLQRNGIIPPMSNPNKREGYMRTTGRLMASIYQQAILARINEVSTVRDARGVPVLPVLPETILDQEWEKVAQSPAVQSFYGGQEALRVKREVDEGFRIEAAKRRGVALDQAHTDLAGREIGKIFDDILATNTVVTTETLKPLSAYLANEVRGYSILNPRELAFDALKLSFSRLAVDDPDAAVRAVRAAEELQVGGVRLGDDRGDVGVSLQQLKRQYQEEADHAVRKHIETEAVRRDQAIQEAEKDYIPLLVQAKRDGVPLSVISRQLGDKYLKDDAENNRFHGYGAFAVDQLETYTMRLDNARPSDQLTLDQANGLMAQGRTDEAEALLRSGMHTNVINGTDFANGMAHLQERRKLSPLVEGSQMYNSVLGRYERLKPTGFSPDVQQRVDERSLELQTRFSQDYVAKAQTVLGQPGSEDTLRAWAEERWRADQGEYRKIEQETRGNRDQAVVEVRGRLDRFQDAGSLIDTGARNGQFTINEAAELRQQNITAAAGRERLLQVDSLGTAEENLRRQWAVVAGNAPTPEDFTLLETAVQEIRDRHAAAVDGILADPTIDPRAFTSRSRSEAVRIGREVQDELFPSLRKQAEAALKSGLGMKGEQDRQTAYRADRALAQNLAAYVADPARREHLSARDLEPLQSDAVPQRFYDYSAGWMSGLDPVIGRRVEREDVVGEAITALRGVPENLRPEAEASIISVLGVDALDVMRGRTELAIPTATQTEIRDRIAFLESPLGAVLSGGAAVDQLRALKARVEPISIDLSEMDLHPLTTPFFLTDAQFRAFRHDPAWPDFLRRLKLSPEDEEQVKEFEDAQADATLRINP